MIRKMRRALLSTARINLFDSPCECFGHILPGPSSGVARTAGRLDGSRTGSYGAIEERLVKSSTPCGFSHGAGRSARYLGGKGTVPADRLLQFRAPLQELERPLKVEEFLDSLKNFETEGVPKGAGTESDEGFDLKRMSRLLLRLGDPLSQYPVVHVAGTKGKGSTVSFLRHIVQAAGFRVGSYTSPHIRSLRERIVSGTTGHSISADAFDQLFDDTHQKLKQAVMAERGALTHFEVLTALAFVHFAREKVDMAIIEAGLGGARDATNVIEAHALLAAIIVGIGEDHLEALGGSLDSIARAKAGIIKEGRPVILGRQKESLAEDVLRQVAASRKALVLPPSGLNASYIAKGICADSVNAHQLCDISVYQSSSSDCDGTAKTVVWTMEDLKIPVLGTHQLDNAATAIQTVLHLRRQGWEIPDVAIRRGLEVTTIPGRFHFATPSEGVELGSHGSTIILDGAHTVGSAIALGKTLRDAFPSQCVALVVAMASDKDQRGFSKAILEGMKPKIVVATTVDIAGARKRATPSVSLATTFRRAGQDLHMEVITDGIHYIHGNSGCETESPLRTISESSRPREEDAASGAMTQPPEPLYVAVAESMRHAIVTAARLIAARNGGKPGVICVTGSLHAVGATMSLLSCRKRIY